LGDGEVCRVYDDVLPPERQKELCEYLSLPGWEWGWRSNRNEDNYRFFHKHFAGSRRADRRDQKTGKVLDAGHDCEDELRDHAPLIWLFWKDIQSVLLVGHTLIRSYANGLQYGSDGTLHTDSVVPWSYTCVYYPHETWDPNWAGETMFFNESRTEVVGVSHPRPNRMCVFPGTVQHVARGVSRTCPVLRITLMFKTEFRSPPLRKAEDAGTTPP
jgi:SM-20-related protein